MRQRWTGALWMVLAGGLLAAVAWAAEVKVPIDQVPAAVKATILAEKGEIEDIAKKTSKDGTVIYEADLVVGKQSIELRVAEDGKVRSRKIEGDVEATSQPDEEESEEATEAEFCQRGAEQLAAAKIDIKQAILAACEENQASKPIEAELEQGKGKPVFEVTLLDGEKTKEIVVDAITGKLLKSEEADEEEEEDEEEESESAGKAGKIMSAAKVTLAQAVETAVAEKPGSKAFFAIFKPEDGQPRYEVMIVAGDKGFEVAIDGVSRKVIEIEAKANDLGKAGEFRSEFKVNKEDWSSTGNKNPYFSLEPGTVSVFQQGKVTLTITVTDKTKMVDGVETRVIEEREEVNGQPEEISQNYFAMNKKTGDVYYFGEAVDEYEDGKVTHEGEWLSGVDGATFGLLMPASPKMGDRFYQEHAPKSAMDRAEIVALDVEVKTPAGAFKCVHVKETSAIEKGVSHKYYAAGIGLVKDDGAVLMQAPTKK